MQEKLQLIAEMTKEYMLKKKKKLWVNTVVIH